MAFLSSGANGGAWPRAISGIAAFVFAAAQGPAQQPRSATEVAECLQALTRHAQDAEHARAAAATVLGLLVDGEVRLRHAALAVVLRWPAQFVPSRALLQTQVAGSPPDDCPLRALVAIAPCLPLPIDESLRLLDSKSSADHERGYRSLLTYDTELLPYLPRLAARLADYSHHELAWKLLKASSVRHGQEVFAALEREMPLARKDRRYTYLVALRDFGAPSERFVPGLLAMLGSQPPNEAATQLRELGRHDATLRARLGDLCSDADIERAREALSILVQLGADAADQWPKVAPCLGSGLLAWQAAQVALQIRNQRPEALVDLLAAVPSADAQRLVTFAMALRTVGEAARAAIPVLAARFPLQDENSSRPVADALFALGGHDELRRLLPGLLTHAVPAVRAHACQLAAALGEIAVATQQQIDRLQQDPDAAVRSEAQFVARLVGGDATPAELADHVQDRDEHRVLATWQQVRRRAERGSAVELLGAQKLLGTQTFSTWVQDELLRDLATRRLEISSFATLWSALPPYPRDQLRARLENTEAGRAVLAEAAASTAALQATGLQQRDRALAELAARNPQLREQLVKQGLLSAGVAVPSSAEQARADAHRILALVTELGHGDAAVRSAACARLVRSPTGGWRDAVRVLRRSGTAAERRTAAALLDTMSFGQALRATEAPEAWVAVRGLETMLRLAVSERPAVPASNLADPLRAVCRRDDVWQLLASEGGGLAPEVLQWSARLGEAGVPLLQSAMRSPVLRSMVIGWLPRLGTAARPFLPDVLRALRTEQRAVAGCALFAIGFDPGDPEISLLRTEVENLWRASQRYERQELLPALAALGTDIAFATEDLGWMLAEGRRGITLSPVQLQLAAGEPLHGWIELALRSDAATQRQIALLMVASASLGAAMNREVVDDLWRSASGSAALGAAMQRLVQEAPASELRRLVGLLLDAAAAGRPLPATRAILGAVPQVVADELPEHVRRRGLSVGMLQELGAVAPASFLRLLEQVEGGENQLLQALSSLAASPENVAQLATMLGRDDVRARPVLAMALVAQGLPALPHIAAQLQGTGAAAMASALVHAGADAEFAVPALRERLRVEPPARDLLVTASRLGPAGIACIVEVLGEVAAVPLLRDAAIAGDSRTRCAALRVLAGIDAAAAVDVARSGVRAGDALVRRWASLVLLPAHGAIADADALLPLFHDASPLLRRRALDALAKAETWPGSLGDVATDLLADPDLGVRRAAVAAFRTHRDEASRSLIALREAAASETDARLVESFAELLHGR